MTLEETKGIGDGYLRTCLCIGTCVQEPPKCDAVLFSAGPFRNGWPACSILAGTSHKHVHLVFEEHCPQLEVRRFIMRYSPYSQASAGSCPFGIHSNRLNARRFGRRTIGFATTAGNH